MVAKRLRAWKHPDTGAANYLKLSEPGASWQKPRSLHLAKYLTNHNHREFKGHRFWPACLLRCGQAPDFYGVFRPIMRSLAMRVAPASTYLARNLMPDKMQQRSATVSDQACREIAASCPLAALPEARQNGPGAPLHRPFRRGRALTGKIRHRATFAACQFAHAMNNAAGVGWIARLTSATHVPGAITSTEDERPRRALKAS